MENASKALLMAGGVLIGVLILALMVTLFISSQDLSKTYEETKQSEAVQQFNVNFTKYLGQNLTIHQAITITNFAIQNDVSVTGGISTANINNETLTGTKTYTLKILEYDDGYISKIQISN